MLAIYKKELRQYFNSMIGFVFLAFFLVIVGIYTWAYNLASGLGNFEMTLDSIYFLFVLLIPILTMRIIAEENHQKTDQLLYTAPISVTRVILAKYFAVLTLFLIGVGVISLYPLLISQYGSDVRLASAYSSIIGFFLFGAACIAIGVFISSLTESQVIAAVVSFIVLLMTFLMSNITGMLPTDALTQCVLLAFIWLIVAFVAYNIMQNVIAATAIAVIGELAIWIVYFVKASLYESLVTNILNVLAISTRFEEFGLGILHYDAIVYYVSISALFVFLTIAGVKGSFQSRKFKVGAYSSLLTVLVIAIVVILNLVFSKLDLTTDLSSGGLFTLTKETKKVVDKMEQDITIYYMVEDGNEEEYIYNVLKQYEKASKHISLKKVDPVVNPSFASNHGIDSEIASSDVIVENDKTKIAKYISYDDMYYSNQSYTLEDSATYLDAEGQVTSAIQSVLSGQQSRMYIMTRHSELELGSSLTDALDKMDIETAELELASLEAVPEDCDILLMNGPSSDLTEEEKNMVLDYLKAGGHAMINIAYTENELPNVEEILNYYGVRLTKGIIFEGAGYYTSYPNAILPSINSEYTPLSELTGYVIFPNAAGLAAEGENALRSSVTITDIMDTSENSYAKTDMTSETIEKEDGDIDGPFSVGLSVTESLEEDKETALIVYSSATAFLEDFTATSQLSNGEVFQKSISSLITSEVEKVSIEAKSMSYSYVSVTPGTQLFWAAVLIIILPAGLLITGFGIWFVRRRK